MICKTERISDEWTELVDRGGLVVPVTTMADSMVKIYAKRPALVTCIMRTEDEQVRLCERLGIPAYRSVHEFWRGVDVSVRGLKPDVIEQVVKQVNRVFWYGRGFLVAKFHMKGTAGHIHLQVPAGETWKTSE